MSSSVASKLATGKHHKKPSDAVTSSSYLPPSINLHSAILDLQSSAGNRAVNTLVHSLGGGAPLPMEMRGEMEQRFGADFSRVRLHTDATAARSAAELNAKAYTVGNNIVFSEGCFSSASMEGKRLLAHELAHVVQQSRGGADPLLDLHAPHENAAEAAAMQAVTASGPITVGGATNVGVARQLDEDVPAQGPQYRISETKLPGGKVRIRVWGLVGDAIDRPGLEKKFPLPGEVGLPGHDRWHLAGPNAIGIDEGIAYTPKNFNISKTAVIENVIRRAREVARNQGAPLYFDFSADCRVVGQHEGVEIRVPETVTWKASLRLPGSDKFISVIDEKVPAVVSPTTATKPGSLAIRPAQEQKEARELFSQATELQQALRKSNKPGANIYAEELSILLTRKIRSANKMTLDQKENLRQQVQDILQIFPEIASKQLPVQGSKVAPKVLQAKSGLKRKSSPALPSSQTESQPASPGTPQPIAAEPAKTPLKPASPSTPAPSAEATSKAASSASIEKTSSQPPSTPIVPAKGVRQSQASKAEHSTSVKESAPTSPTALKTEPSRQTSASPKAIPPGNETETTTTAPPQPTAAPKVSAPAAPAQVTAQPIKAADSQAASTPKPSPESAAMAQTSEETAQPQKTPVKTSQAKTSVSVQQHASSPDGRPRATVKGSRTVHTEFGDRVKVAVEDIHGATDTPFRVTTTITLNTGAGGGASVEKPGAGTAGANVSATGRISVSFSRMMSDAEKEKYLAAVGARRGGTTDLQVIELIASGNEGQAANLLQTVQQRLYGTGPLAAPREGALGAPPREGEYVEVDVEGDLTAGVSAGRGGIGGHAQRSMGKGLRQRSMYVGGKEQITVALTDRSSNAKGGSVGVGAGSMGLTGHEGQSVENAVEFTLDPDPKWKEANAQIRRALLTAVSVDDLRAIEAAHPNYPNLVTGRLESEERSTGRDTDLTVAGFGPRLKRSGAIGKGSERRGEKTYPTVTGIGKTGVGWVAGDREINISTKTDSLHGRGGPGNEGEAITQSERSEIDISKSLSTVTEQLNAHLLGTSVAVAKGQKKILQNRVDTKGTFLSSASIARIAELAKDENKGRWLRAWDFTGITQGAAPEWEATRQKIRDAEGKQDVILEAIAEWVAGAGGRSGDVERLAGETGEAFQFSDENAEQKQNFDDLVLHDPTEKAHRLAEAGNRKAAIAELQAINRQLGSLAQNIQQFTIGIETRRLNAMLDRVYARRQAIASELVALQAGDVAPREGALHAPEVADTERTREEVGQRIHDLTALCVTNQYKEGEVLDRVTDKLDTKYLRGTEYAAVRNEMDELEAVYAKWDANVEELKQLRKQLGLSPDFAKGVAPNRARFQALRSDPKLRRVQGQ